MNISFSLERARVDRFVVVVAFFSIKYLQNNYRTRKSTNKQDIVADWWNVGGREGEREKRRESERENERDDGDEHDRLPTTLLTTECQKKRYTTDKTQAKNNVSNSSLLRRITTISLGRTLGLFRWQHARWTWHGERQCFAFVRVSRCGRGCRGLADKSVLDRQHSRVTAASARATVTVLCSHGEQCSSSGR